MFSLPATPWGWGRGNKDDVFSIFSMVGRYLLAPPTFIFLPVPNDFFFNITATISIYFVRNNMSR